MKKLSKRQLKEHNRKVAARGARSALTDRAARAKTKELWATGDVTTAQKRAVESTLRQSRRENAAYNRAHVHVGVAPQEDSAPAMELPEPRKEQQKQRPEERRAEKIERSALKTAEREGSVASDAFEAQTQGAADRLELGHKAHAQGVANLDDSEGVHAGRDARIPNAGPRFKQTEEAAARAVRGARKWDHFWDRQAWEPFAAAHGQEAALIRQIEQYQPSDRTLELADAMPDTAFEAQLARWCKKFGKGREKHYQRGRDAWQTWKTFRAQYRREHPDVQPDAGPSVPHRYPDPVPNAVAAILRGDVYGRAPTVPAVNVPEDKLVTEWQQAGMPLGGLGLARLKSLEQVMRELDEVARWETPMRARAMENSARDRWWERHRKYRPRSLLD